MNFEPFKDGEYLFEIWEKGRPKLAVFGVSNDIGKIFQDNFVVSSIFFRIEGIDEGVEQIYEGKKCLSTDWDIVIFRNMHEVRKQHMQSKVIATIFAKHAHDLNGD